MPLADPFLQFEPQQDCFFGSSLNSAFNHSTSTLGLATGGSSSKSIFDTTLGFYNPFHGNLIPTTSDNFENTLFKTYTVL